ncbi:hypothetical protein U14_00027 [Candidatus Moduliflexus flocculans]|uniref:RNA-binding protein KhpB n=1 Tax=Candidatus Moduliflexus flocculans TaxID=1499966 RepID=A0A0S6VUK6_9BACT|nr:hypothetical protein U14_00027 [Candidatus Moduliflexus flocculans]
MKMIEAQGKTIDDAINNALQELQVGREQVAIQILDEGSRGLLGFGARPAKIRASVKEETTYSALKEELQKEEPVNASLKNERKPEEKKRPRRQQQEETELKKEYDPAEVQKIIAASKLALSEILKHLEIEYTVDANLQDDQIHLNIHCENENFLIGKHGTTLDAVQYLVNRIANKDAKDKIQVVLDTSDYRENRNQRLEKIAQRLSKRVKMTGKSASTPPMNPHDRRVIHLALQDDPAITTLSRGTGFMRKIVVTTKRNSNRSRKSAS